MQIGELPTPSIDPDIDRAPGGADASVTESDVGAADPAPLTPDPPFAAQKDDDVVPDAIQEPEERDSSAVEDPQETASEPPA